MANGTFYDEGLHVATVIDQALTESKEKHTPCLVLLVKILGEPGVDPATFVPHDKQYERSIYMYITKATMPFFTETLKTLGFEGTKITQLDKEEPGSHSFVGDQINVWCKHEDDLEGNQRERWQVSRAPQLLQVPPINKKAGRELDSMFAAALRDNRGPKTKVAQDRGGDPGITDADLPGNMQGDNIDDSDLPF
jgi:hypothetical protein